MSSTKRLRFNFAQINPDKIKTNSIGGVVVEGAIIKTGVFEYQTEDGGIVNEYLPPSELFKESVLETLEGSPLTNDHPDDMVNPENFRYNAVGFVKNVRKEKNKFVIGDVIINDSETIELIISGDKKELSAGYYTDPIQKKGITPDGEPYDVVQTNIVFNHVSLVEKGRCGPDVSLRLNSVGNQITDKTDIFMNNKKRKENMSKPVKKNKVASESTEKVSEEVNSEKENVSEEVKNSNDFERRVQEEVEARLTLLTAAKQLGVPNLSVVQPKEELMLQIVKTTKPHMDLNGKSEDYKRALLEDSLSGVDINAFWVTTDSSKDDQEELVGNAESEEEIVCPGSMDDEEFTLDNDIVTETGVQSESTLNSFLSTIRVKKDILGKSSNEDIYGSVEQQARMLLNWHNKKLI